MPCRELELRSIGFKSQVNLPVIYKGTQVAKASIIDLLIEDLVIVEIKAVEKVTYSFDPATHLHALPESAMWPPNEL
jgi:GxxExxY protein